LKTDEVRSETFVIGGYPWYDIWIWMNEFPHVRIYSICRVIFVCFDLLWFCFRKILLYPEGCDELGYYLSIYLEAVKTASMSEGCSRDVKFKLLVFNQLDANMTISEGIHFLFLPSQQTTN
jgi:hypothetical protein